MFVKYSMWVFKLFFFYVSHVRGGWGRGGAGLEMCQSARALMPFKKREGH